MAIIYEPLEIRGEDGKGTGRYQMTSRSDELGHTPFSLCDCEDGHDSIVGARECPSAAAVLKGAFPTPPEENPLVGRFMWLNPGQYAKIIEKTDPDALGHVQLVEPYHDGERLVVVEIGLDSSASRAAQFHILLHELLHLAAETLKSSGDIARQPDEAFVTHAAGPLFSFLAANNLISGISSAEVRKWVAEVADSGSQDTSE